MCVCVCVCVACGFGLIVDTPVGAAVPSPWAAIHIYSPVTVRWYLGRAWERMTGTRRGGDLFSSGYMIGIPPRLITVAVAHLPWSISYRVYVCVYVCMYVCTWYKAIIIYHCRYVLVVARPVT